MISELWTIATSDRLTSLLASTVLYLLCLTTVTGLHLLLYHLLYLPGATQQIKERRRTAPHVNAAERRNKA